MPLTRPRHWLRWLIGAIVVLIALAAGEPLGQYTIVPQRRLG